MAFIDFPNSSKLKKCDANIMQSTIKHVGPWIIINKKQSGQISSLQWGIQKTEHVSHKLVDRTKQDKTGQDRTRQLKKCSEIKKNC